MSFFPVISESVYNGRDNAIVAVLLNNDAPIADLSSVTRVTFTVGATTIDSDVVGSTVVWWTDSITYRGVSTNVIKLKLGGQSLTAGEYGGCELVIYDSVLTNGVQIENPFKVTVFD